MLDSIRSILTPEPHPLPVRLVRPGVRGDARPCANVDLTAFRADHRWHAAAFDAWCLGEKNRWLVEDVGGVISAYMLFHWCDGAWELARFGAAVDPADAGRRLLAGSVLFRRRRESIAAYVDLGDAGACRTHAAWGMSSRLAAGDQVEFRWPAERRDGAGCRGVGK